MRSLILTTLYLAKDTVHRWLTRISSPLARVLVVFFLTLCALSFMGIYAISTKVVHERIVDKGANMVGAIMTNTGEQPLFIPSQPEIDRLLNADSYALNGAGTANLPNGMRVNIYTCAFSRLNQIFPLLAPGGGPTLLQDGVRCNLPEGPSEITLVGGRRQPIYVRTLSPRHPLMNMMDGRGVIMQPDLVDRQYASVARAQYALVICVRDLTSSDSVARAEQFLYNLLRLESSPGNVYSALRLLRELDIVIRNQVQCRIIFCGGICIIVGILLTALAGMEYRQNEYIYTLMKSFGIHPILLVGSFIVENLIIVGGSFVAAVATFMYSQRIIVAKIFKETQHILTLEEIAPEIQLICYSLLGCVAISAVPIYVAAHREIGRVLK